MELVVDANVPFSAAVKDSSTAALLFRDDVHLHAPESLFTAFDRYRDTLLERTHRDAEDFDHFVRILKRRIKTVPREIVPERQAAAGRVSPDSEDVAYFAVASHLDAALWSDDKALGNRRAVPVFTTTDLVERFEF